MRKIKSKGTQSLRVTKILVIIICCSLIQDVVLSLIIEIEPTQGNNYADVFIRKKPLKQSRPKKFQIDRAYNEIVDEVWDRNL